MVMTDANPTQNIVATVDPKSVAQMVVELQRQQQAPQAKPSKFQDKVNSLLQSGNVDKDNLAEITSLQQAAMEDLKEELKSSGLQTISQNTYSRCTEAVHDALERYIEGDEQLEECAKDLQRRVEEKIAGNPEAMAKLNRGELDKLYIKSVSKEVVEAFNKNALKRDKQAKGVATTSGISGTNANQAIENTAPVGSIDEIADPGRREAYFKFNALLKRNKFSTEDAHKKAFAMASKPFKKQGSAA